MINTILYIVLIVQISLTDEIKNANKGMEQAFNSGDLNKVASYYADDAVLLSANGNIVEGRRDIDAYWTKISNPVSWQLDVIEVSTSEREIYENPYYQSLKNKPLDWRVHGYEFDNKENLVYQLGHSTLTTKRDGEEKSSQVDFILIWQATDDGYKILLDTYAW